MPAYFVIDIVNIAADTYDNSKLFELFQILFRQTEHCDFTKKNTRVSFRRTLLIKNDKKRKQPKSLKKKPDFFVINIVDTAADSAADSYDNSKLFELFEILFHQTERCDFTKKIRK